MLRLKDKYEGLDLTEAERATVEKYKAWLADKIAVARMQRYYAEIDGQYPELDPETRDKLATALYRKAMVGFALRARNTGPKKKAE